MAWEPSKKLCDAIGVKPNEPFRYFDKVYRVSELGSFERHTDDGWHVEYNVIANILCGEPSSVRRLSRWTSEDVENAKIIRHLFPWAQRVQRSKDGKTSTLIESGGNSTVLGLNPPFEALMWGETVDIDEILASEGVNTWTGHEEENQ